MDAQTLSEVMGNTLSLAQYERLLPGMEGAMIAAQINTPDRAAMWCAQIGHESSGLRHMEEIASGAAYEWRADLGNVRPGDGRKFKGSGPIQLTGRANFRAFTRWARANGHSNIDFEAEPHLVREDPKWGFLAASYYWTAARPQLNTLSDRRDLNGATRAINGGLNGITDRKRRYDKARSMGSRIMPGGERVIEKILEYPRNEVTQDTIYNCGPASVQTIIAGATGKMHTEAFLGKQLGTHTGGTDWIGQFPRVLNSFIPEAKYAHTELPNDPPGQAQKDTLWRRVVSSIDAGYGVVANIVAPPSNYPRAVAPSTINFAYGSGTVYHYIAVMGYRVESNGTKKVWISDSGFYPYGGFISFDQLASLIPPKGYAYATADPKVTQKEGNFLSALTPAEQREVLNLARESHTLIRSAAHELTHRFQSRYDLELYRQGKIEENQIYSETMTGYGLDDNRKIEDVHANMLPTMHKILTEILAEVKKEMADEKK